jgi:hypothetical protein
VAGASSRGLTRSVRSAMSARSASLEAADEIEGRR